MLLINITLINTGGKREILLVYTRICTHICMYTVCAYVKYMYASIQYLYDMKNGYFEGKKNRVGGEGTSGRPVVLL